MMINNIIIVRRLSPELLRRKTKPDIRRLYKDTVLQKLWGSLCEPDDGFIETRVDIEMVKPLNCCSITASRDCRVNRSMDQMS